MFSLFSLKTEFSKNVMILMTGTSIAQAIPILVSPILTRLYTPEEFGIFAIYMSIVNIIAVIATGRYELAIIVPKNQSDAVNLLALSLSISLFVTSLFAIIILLFNESIADWFNNPDLAYFLLFLPISILLTSIIQTLSFWLNRKKNYKCIAKSRVSRRGTAAVSNIGFGNAQIGASGLVFGGILGQSIASLLLAVPVWLEHRIILLEINQTKMISMAKKYSNFLKFNSLQAFVDMLRDNGINIFIQMFFSSTILGFYYLAIRIVKNPLNIIGSAISQVFYREIAEANNNNKVLYPLVKKIIIKLLLISIPIFLTLYLIAPTLFSIIFGSSWEISGQYVQALIPWFFVNFITSPVTTVPIIQKRQGTFLIIGIIYTIIALLSVYTLCKLNLEVIEIINILSLILSIYLLATLAWIIFISRIRESKDDL